MGLLRQYTVEDALQVIFPGCRWIKNARKASSIKHPTTGKFLEVDVWYPDLQLCFEYQDEHHYQNVFYLTRAIHEVQQNDEIKRSQILQKGETLVPIPFWWDGNLNSLQATVQFHRPDLSNLFSTQIHAHEMIPANPPSELSSVHVELALVSFYQSLLHKNHRLWWFGEKYDGVRCCWKPDESQLYSRQGLPISMHSSVNSLFGNIALDGELWCGRGHFLETVTIVQEYFHNWALLKVICFDEASSLMTNQPFEVRYALILSHFLPNHPTTIVAPRILLHSEQLMTHFLLQVLEDGGEGLILQQPYSVYSHGRSANLVKVKGHSDQGEALVVDVAADGSLLLQLPEGIQFKVPKADVVLHRRAVSGDVVSFSYDFARHRLTQALHKSDIGTDSYVNYGHTPPHPFVHCFREDVHWGDLPHHSLPLSPKNPFLNEPHQKIQAYTAKPQDKNRIYKKKLRGLKNYLQNFMKQKKLDSLIAENWYNVSSEIMQLRKIRNIETLYKALAHLYPKLQLDKARFMQRANWRDRATHRNWFDAFAKLKKI
eukprot:Phypoly_transcript_03119.p1 GENE.Phypoly_transcript_03119~~Phypoly_transcript_03119.p1  ORF type:complete len:559 (+),score=49.29 Phypoly_transcript_03119:51-1679(+)